MKNSFHKNGILGRTEIENNLNICKLKNGNIAIGIRKGDTSLVYELDKRGLDHVISILSTQRLKSAGAVSHPLE